MKYYSTAVSDEEDLIIPIPKKLQKRYRIAEGMPVDIRCTKSGIKIIVKTRDHA